MKKIPLSFEFFPPKTEEGIANLRRTRQQLAKFQPEFFSVTFGAGGSTRDRTMDAVFEIQEEGYAAAPHISCISATKEEVLELLKAYQAKGIKRLVTLRGDLPSGVVSVGDFKYANELVSFIRQETGNWVILATLSKKWMLAQTQQLLSTFTILMLTFSFLRVVKKLISAYLLFPV